MPEKPIDLTTDDSLQTLRVWSQLAHSRRHSSGRRSAQALDALRLGRELVLVARLANRDRIARWAGVQHEIQQAFKPLGDPSLLDLETHRWLQHSREEAYSNWLAWLLHRLGKPGSNHCKDALRLLGIHNDNLATRIDEMSPDDFSVHREMYINYPESKKHGRPDILIQYKGQLAMLVEVKVNPYKLKPDAKEHKYFQWFQKECPSKRSEFLMLGPCSNYDDTTLYGKWRFRNWREVALEVRTTSVTLIKEGHLYEAALALAFAAAVEKNVIGLDPLPDNMPQNHQHDEVSSYVKYLEAFHRRLR